MLANPIAALAGTPIVSVSPDEARNIAKQAYIYGFPLVMGYKTIYNYAVNKESPYYKGPFNKLSCKVRLFTPADRAIVTPNKEIQGSYNLQPLSAFLGNITSAAAPSLNFPVWVEGSQLDERFFRYLDFMLSLLEKPHEEEKPLWDRFTRLGLGPQNTFDFSALPAQIQNAVKAGIKEGFGEIEQIINEFALDRLASAKVFGSREFLQKSAKENYGDEDHYLIRAAAAHIGLYGNSAAESIYLAYLVDQDGKPYDTSKNRFTLTFEKGQLPPVSAFWSLTMYDGKTQLFIENPLDRYLLNSAMIDQFKMQDDGSIILHIGKDSPGAGLESNWLPAPDGPFYLMLRLYGPEPAALEGKWTPPNLYKGKLQLNYGVKF